MRFALCANMLIFLYGPDAYRLQQTKQNIIKEYRRKHSSGMNIFDFDLSNASYLEKLLDTVKSLSFFSEHKLLVCKYLFDNKITASMVAEYISKYNLHTISDLTLMAVENFSEKDLALKHKELFRLLSSKNNMVKNIENLEGARLTEWIWNEFDLRGCSIDDEALKKLIIIVGNDSWALINEIEKLCVYKKRGNVVVADLELLIIPKVNLNIFDLIDAIGARNNKKAFELLYHELKTGRDPYYLLTMVIYQFRNLLVVKDLQRQKYSESEIAIKAKLHPFVVKKALKSPFQFDEVVKIYNQLFSIDTGFKMGKISLEDSLYNLVVV